MLCCSVLSKRASCTIYPLSWYFEFVVTFFSLHLLTEAGLEGSTIIPSFLNFCVLCYLQDITSVQVQHSDTVWLICYFWVLWKIRCVIVTFIYPKGVKYLEISHCGEKCWKTRKNQQEVGRMLRTNIWFSSVKKVILHTLRIEWCNTLKNYF